jgi:hypothetical protein
VADQYWLRVVGFLQPPPAREVLHRQGYYRGEAERAAALAAGARPGAAAAVASRDESRGGGAGVPLEITAGDRLIYFALGPFVVYAVGTVTSDPEPHPQDPLRCIVTVQTDVFINSIMKAPHFGGIALPSGRDLRLLVERYTYLWLSPEDGQALVEKVHAKAGAKD